MFKQISAGDKKKEETTPVKDTVEELLLMKEEDEINLSLGCCWSCQLGQRMHKKDEYDYYTRVFPFVDWIKKTMEENRNPEDEE